MTTKKDLKKLAKLAINDITKVPFTVGDDSVVLEVKRTVSMLERAQIVDEVVSAVFVDEVERITDEDGAEQLVTVSEGSVYMPINKSFALNMSVLIHFAQCPYKNEEDAALIQALAENPAVMDKVFMTLSAHVIDPITQAIDDAIAYKQMQLTALGAHDLAMFNMQVAPALQFLESDEFKSMMVKLDKDTVKMQKVAKNWNLK